MGNTFEDAKGMLAKAGAIIGAIGKPRYGVTKITMAAVGSYKDKVEIPLDKLNFFYGLNGTGKTTIAKYLANNAHADYSQCKLELSNPQKPLVFVVYNEDYIEKNFRANPKQPGIFTLDKDNAEAYCD